MHIINDEMVDLTREVEGNSFNYFRRGMMKAIDSKVVQFLQSSIRIIVVTFKT